MIVILPEAMHVIIFTISNNNINLTYYAQLHVEYVARMILTTLKFKEWENGTMEIKLAI